MNTNNPEWTCPNCKQVFVLCRCGGNDGDGERKDILPTRDKPVGDNPDSDNGQYIPGYNCPSPGLPFDPVHIQ